MVALLAGCASQPAPVDSPARELRREGASGLAEEDSLDERALLLLLADQQLHDPFTIDRAMRGSSALRVDLARSLGRAGDFSARQALEGLLLDGDLEVVREAAFALGLLGDSEAISVLLPTAGHPDPEVGRLAVEALAKLGAPILRVVTALGDLSEAETAARLAPSLFRFPAEEALPYVRRTLLDGGESNFRATVYALARNPLPESVPILRDLLRDPDPWLRGWAARALGQVGDSSDLERLLPLLKDVSEGPVIQALRSLRRLVLAGEGVPHAGWRPELLELLDDPRPGVRLSAIETAGAWKGDDAVSTVLLRIFETRDGRDQELALLALAASDHPRASELVSQASVSSDATLRVAAIGAAGLLGARDVLERLLEDPAVSVRASAVTGALRVEEGDAALAIVALSLTDEDPIVRAAGFDWLAEHPIVAVQDLFASLGGIGSSDVVEAKFSAISAIEARAKASVGERDAAVAGLGLLAREAEFVLRAKAADSLEALGETRPGRGTVESSRKVGDYRSILRQTDRPRTVSIATSHGEIQLELACPQAPLTCLNFLQLVAQGYFDGLPFHRVVPDFVAQGGDPRGDGYGGPGYMIRDEINRLRYERGSVGMALAGPHTGGSQFFIAMAPQPHLDGGYTVFGRVVEGMEHVDALRQGDRMLRVQELGGPLR